MDNIRFRVLTYEDLQNFLDTDFTSITTKKDVVVGVAVNDNNECISISSQNWRNRGLMCDSCTLDCGQGGVVWTRPDYQSQGIFTMLFRWTAEQAGIQKTYVSWSGAYYELLANKYNLLTPKSEMLSERPDEQSAVSYLETAGFADKITEWLQNGN